MLRCLCGCFSEITAFFSFDFYYFTSRFVQKLQRYVINLQKREERREKFTGNNEKSFLETELTGSIQFFSKDFSTKKQ